MAPAADSVNLFNLFQLLSETLASLLSIQVQTALPRKVSSALYQSLVHALTENIKSLDSIHLIELLIFLIALPNKIKNDYYDLSLIQELIRLLQYQFYECLVQWMNDYKERLKIGNSMVFNYNDASSKLFALKKSLCIPDDKPFLAKYNNKFLLKSLTALSLLDSPPPQLRTQILQCAYNAAEITNGKMCLLLLINCH